MPPSLSKFTVLIRIADSTGTSLIAPVCKGPLKHLSCWELEEVLEEVSPWRPLRDSGCLCRSWVHLEAHMPFGSTALCHKLCTTHAIYIFCYQCLSICTRAVCANWQMPMCAINSPSWSSEGSSFCLAGLLWFHLEKDKDAGIRLLPDKNLGFFPEARKQPSLETLPAACAACAMRDECSSS